MRRAKFWIAGGLAALALVALLWSVVRRPAGVPSASLEDRQRVDRVAARLARQAAPESDPERAARRLTRLGQTAAAADVWQAVLGAHPGDPQALLGLAILSFRTDRPVALSRAEAEAVVRVMADDNPDAKLLPAAQAWMRVTGADPAGAAAALDGAPVTADGQEALLLALVAMGQDPSPAAERLLSLEPDHDEACAAIGRQAWAAGDLPRALTTVERCLAAGADSPVLWRSCGDIFDRVGAFEAAAARYARAGATLHAAAVIYQEGLPDPSGALAALDEPVPPAVLHRGWRAILAGDRPAVAQAAAELRQMGVAGPQFATFLASAALVAGAPADALAQEDLDAPAMVVVRARSRALLGEPEVARSAVLGLLEQHPWRRELWRESMAIHPAGFSQARALLDVDPVLLALARDMREREMPWPAVAPAGWPARDGVEGAAIALIDHGEWRAEVWEDPEGSEPDETRFAAFVHGAWAALQQGDLAAAGARLDRATALAPSEPPETLAIVRAEWLRRTGQSAPARALLEPLQEGPSKAWALATLLGDGSVEDRARGSRMALDAAIATPELSGLWALGLQLGLPEDGVSLDSRCALD